MFVKIKSFLIIVIPKLKKGTEYHHNHSSKAIGKKKKKMKCVAFDKVK